MAEREACNFQIDYRAEQVFQESTDGHCKPVSEMVDAETDGDSLGRLSFLLFLFWGLRPPRAPHNSRPPASPLSIHMFPRSWKHMYIHMFPRSLKHV